MPSFPFPVLPLCLQRGSQRGFSPISPCCAWQETPSRSPFPRYSRQGRVKSLICSAPNRYTDALSTYSIKPVTVNQLIKDLLAQALAALPTDLVPAGARPAELHVERTRDRAHGDFASNLALALAKPARRKPRELAAALCAALPAHELIRKVEIAGPGFINFYLAPAAYHAELRAILKTGEAYGRNNSGGGRRAQVEFVSANPTGPLHVGHGRGAAMGDCLVRLLIAAGWDASREFYYNDAGAQINNLALSVQARCKQLEPEQPGWPADGYRGDYIKEVARAYLAGETVHADGHDITGAADVDDLDAIRRFGRLPAPRTGH